MKVLLGSFLCVVLAVGVGWAALPAPGDGLTIVSPEAIPVVELGGRCKQISGTCPKNVRGCVNPGDDLGNCFCPRCGTNDCYKYNVYQ